MLRNDVITQDECASGRQYARTACGQSMVKCGQDISMQGGNDMAMHCG